MLPSRSIETVNLASRHHLTKRSRISLSESVRARRARPPSRPLPILPDCSMVDQRRSPLMRAERGNAGAVSLSVSSFNMVVTLDASEDVAAVNGDEQDEVSDPVRSSRVDSTEGF